MKCKHGLAIEENPIGEKICYCEIWAEWRNITLGDCIRNCESEEKAEPKGGKNENT